MKMLKWTAKEEDKKKIAKVHQKLFGYKVLTYPDRVKKCKKEITPIKDKDTGVIKYYYTYKGILGGYDIEGNHFRYPTVEKIGEGCYLIAEEKINEVQNILNGLGVIHTIEENFGIHIRGDWRRR